MKTKLLIGGAVLGALVAAVPAMAHDTAATAACDEATFTYTQFPNQPQSANWRVTADDQVVGAGTFAFQGGPDAALNTVHYDLSPGTHTIKAYTWWIASDGNVRSIEAPPVATMEVTCTAPTPPAPPAPPAPPVEQVLPPAPAPEAPAATFSSPAASSTAPPVVAAATQKKVVKHHKKPVKRAKATPKKKIVKAAKPARIIRLAPKLTG